MCKECGEDTKKRLTVENGYGWIVCSRVDSGYSFGLGFLHGVEWLGRDETEEDEDGLADIGGGARFLQIGSQDLNDHVHLHRQPLLFYIPPFTCNQEDPSRCNIWCKVRPERWNVPCRKADLRARSFAVTPDKAAVGQTNEVARGLRLTHAVFQFDVLEQGAFEILQLIRSWRNTAVPINRIPPEILAHIPDFWDTDDRDQDAIVLTHVCRTWRGVFISQSSLWTDLDCTNLNKTRTYLERSKSSPINLSLYRGEDLSLCDPFIQIIPHAIGRLESLSVTGTRGNLQDITAHLSQPAPLLRDLSICGSCEYQQVHNPGLTPALFNGDLSSLRKLRLDYICTDLPWRNMVNLTSFILANASPMSVGQLLDFFEGAHCLREVELHSATPTSGAQHGRLVSLACLKRMYTTGGGPSALLLDHLLIPVGARLAIEVDLPTPPTEDSPPRFLDNLRNLTDFTIIQLYDEGSNSHMLFSGPNGQVRMTPRISRLDGTCSVLEYLAQFDTSKTEQLEIIGGNSASSGPPSQALLPMKDLCTLTLYLCANPHVFIHALDPSVNASGIMVCPKLEKLIIDHRDSLEIKDVIGMAAARESRGAKLKFVMIISWDRSVYAQSDVLELKKHVLRVEVK